MTTHDTMIARSARVYRRLFGGNCSFVLGVVSALLAADIRGASAQLSETCRRDTSLRPSSSATRPTVRRMIPLHSEGDQCGL